MSGRRVHSTGTLRGSILRTAAIRVLVQCHITGPSPHATILCCSESEFPHFTQELVSVRRMVARRSFVGRMSCIAWYQVEMMVSDASIVCRFFHTLSQQGAGYLRVIRMSVASSEVAAIAWSIPYMRCLNCFIVLVTPGSAT